MPTKKIVSDDDDLEAQEAALKKQQMDQEAALQRQKEDQEQQFAEATRKLEEKKARKEKREEDEKRKREEEDKRKREEEDKRKREEEDKRKREEEDKRKREEEDKRKKAEERKSLAEQKRLVSERVKEIAEKRKHLGPRHGATGRAEEARPFTAASTSHRITRSMGPAHITAEHQEGGSSVMGGTIYVKNKARTPAEEGKECERCVRNKQTCEWDGINVSEQKTSIGSSI
jgi:hypothetical protein